MSGMRSTAARGTGEGRVRRSAIAPSAVLAIALSLGCASGGAPGEEGPLDGGVYGASTAEAAVSGFLDAVNSEDYRSMGRLFGSGEGPALERWGSSEVEQRMFVLASLLAHSGYGLRKAQLTEGPNRQRYLADMAGTRNGDVTVPFIAVLHEGRWFVERVETEALTRTRG